MDWFVIGPLLPIVPIEFICDIVSNIMYNLLQLF